jgi:pimeloyl-ACP methyl ester carboxylesterase
VAAAIAAGAVGAAYVAGKHVTTPRPIVRVEDLAESGDEFVDLLGLRVRVRSAGQGEPALVLLHGFGASVFSWRLVLPVLAQDRQVVAFDRPAFGLTSRPAVGEWDPSDWPAGGPYGPEAQVTLTVALLDQLGLERVVLVGHSMGGAVAAATAVAHPERVAGLVLVDSAVDMGGPPEWITGVGKVPGNRTWGPWFTRLLLARPAAALKPFFADPATVTPEVVEGYTGPMGLPGWDRALWELTLAGQIPLDATALGGLAVPTLVLRGKEDRLVSATKARATAEVIPGAEFLTIPAAGHVPQEEQPELFTAAVSGFLKRRFRAD